MFSGRSTGLELKLLTHTEPPAPTTTVKEALPTAMLRTMRGAVCRVRTVSESSRGLVTQIDLSVAPETGLTSALYRYEPEQFDPGLAGRGVEDWSTARIFVAQCPIGMTRLVRCSSEDATVIDYAEPQRL